jgi:FLYWCH zinc finger domain
MRRIHLPKNVCDFILFYFFFKFTFRHFICSHSNYEFFFLYLKIFIDYPVGVWSEIKYRYVTGDDGIDLLKLANGFVFRKEAKFKNHTDWVCINNKLQNKKCTARVAVNTENQLKFSRAKHNHKA